MAEQTRYRTAPDPEERGWPGGVPYIIGNEGCERFSFYGMKSILQVHLTALFVVAGIGGVVSETHAQEVVHLFIAGVYAFPMIGAIIADRLWGKYNTIIVLSLVYCAGHAVLALGEDSLPGMYLGLGLIAVGSGGIKPCVSAHVGDQFGKGNWPLVTKVFQIFYWIINFGSFFATLMIPWLRVHYGTSVAFGLPGILMFIATIWFWMGRHKFVHIQPKPGGRLGVYDAVSGSLLFMGFIGLPLFFTSILSPLAFWGTLVGCVASGLWIFSLRQKRQADDGFLAVMFGAIAGLLSGENRKAIAEATATEEEADDLGRHWLFAGVRRRMTLETVEGPRAVLRIISVFFLVSVFWALFDQHASSWIRQAKRMDLNVDMLGMSLELLPSQIGALNPLMVMALIPLNNWFLYPLVERFGVRLTPLRKMSVGMMMASVAFVAVALIQQAVDVGLETGDKLTVLWQVIPYLIMTQAEVMVSITGLEFAYTQAPARMKSTIMGFWLLCVAFGSKIVVILTGFEGLNLENFFWVFAALMAGAAVLFALRASMYEYRDYTQ